VACTDMALAIVFAIVIPDVAHTVMLNLLGD
jgi:hypothetical protein